jgi:hypothetical protein
VNRSSLAASARAIPIRKRLSSETCKRSTPCHQRVLVRIEAPCDHAQGKAGPLLFALRVVITAADKKKSGIPETWWESPPLRRADIAVLGGADKLLLVNTRALFIPVGDELAASGVLFRLRPPLAGLVSFHRGMRTIRPAIIEFR